MKVLQYWKRVDMPRVGGITFDLVPIQTVTDDKAFFSRIYEVVKASECDFVLIERKESVLDFRGEWDALR